jgi:7-cyano-7-deazaguanine synthase
MNPETKKIVIGLSGGMDSVTLLGLLLQQGYEVHCCLFQYGSKHNKWERMAAEEVIQYYQNLKQPVFSYEMDLAGAMWAFKSNLLKTGGEIPEGHYEAESMRQTVVPGRNMIMAAVMAGLAESIGASAVALGVHQGDHHIYPDCRKEFIKAIDTAVYLSSNRQVEVWAPLLNDTKTSILKRGMPIGVPYELTRTCYKDQPRSCKKCGSCRERLEAFDNIGYPDPILYEEM